MDDTNLLNILRSSNLLPKNLEEFKIFVNQLVSSPVHDASVERVWKMLYTQDRDGAVSSTEDFEEKLKERNCPNIGSALDKCNVKQICESLQHDKGKSSQESTVSSSNDIEVISCVNSNIIKQVQDESDSSASVEILDEHQVVQPSSHRNTSTCAIHGSKQVHINNESDDQSCQDDIVILDELHKKGIELKKRKKKRMKLKKLKAEVHVIKSILVNLCETSVKNNVSVENTIRLLDLKEKERLKNTNLVKHKGQGLNNASNTSSRKEEKSRKMSQDDRGSSSPNTSSSSSKKIRDKFMWHDAIIDTINSKPQKRISIDRLKKKVITRYMLYRGSISGNTLHKFLKYLHTAPGVIVENGYATLNVSENIQEVVPLVAGT